MSSVHKRGFHVTLRARVLAIALVPSLVLLSAGVGLSAYLIVNALQQRDRAQLLGQGYQMAVPFMPTMSQERRAGILVVAAPTPENRAALSRARGDMDGLLARFSAISTQVAGTMPPDAKAAIGRFVSKIPQIITTRAAIDAGKASRLDVYRAYSDVADAMIIAAAAIGRDSTDKEVALQRTMAADLMHVSDWLDRSNALAAGALAGGGMTLDELHEYNRLTQGYHAELAALAPRLEEQHSQLAALYSSPEWGQLSKVENAIVEHGFAAPAQNATDADPPVLPVSTQNWQNAARHSATMLSSMGLGDLGTRAAALEEDKADTALLRSLIAALGMLFVVGVVLIVAIRLSSRLIRRLVQLRTETLKLADERLPQVVQRLRAGERIDVAAEVPELDHGRDEIGQVAAAFNKAQQTAVAAAVQEAKTREGINAVFLNIARRSQAIVHRQLQVLDTAERATDDPDQLEQLFQLDHLTTRERRNAENLIILGGGQLGRQWRNAVSLVEIVRSAVAEAEQYTRVTITRVPNVLVDGRAVADLIHLMAELIDNATSFSPPGSRIEVRGNPVGKGVVIEVEDQGLGIESERRENFNEMFRNPPDFGLIALSNDARIGFFVVAHLAHQHGIRVTLQESAYGGVRAGVLIPSELMPSPGDDGERAAVHQTSPSIPKLAVAPDGELAASAATPRPRETDDRPALPRRRPQEHLARQLREQPAAGGDGESSEPDFDRAAKHARSTLSAFQQGTQRGRAGDDEPGQ
ncbi:MAG TPA: nitrate- and nitrite sensing domain-containing protein [Pseudonocardiaceae bacterium]|nr:nitrate- and nitrite sensing domain-containing protein [Pseudonocardiaceae bacterium]